MIGLILVFVFSFGIAWGIAHLYNEWMFDDYLEG